MRLLRIFLIFFAIYLVFVGGGAYYHLSFEVRVLHHIVMNGVLLAWIGYRLFKQRGLPPTPLDRPLMALLIIWGLSSLLGLSPRMSLEFTWFLLLHVLLFYFVVNLIQHGHSRLLLESLFFVSVALLMITGFEVWDWYQTSGVAVASLRNLSLSNLPTLNWALSISTLQAGFVAPFVTIFAGWAATTHKPAYRPILGLMSVLLLLVLLLTKSRGGVLSLVFALSVLSLLWGGRRLGLSERFTRTQLAVGLGGILAGIVVLVIGVIAPFGELESDLRRLDMYTSALEMTRDNPLLGVGVGMFGRAFREYRDPSIVQDKITSAHNLYLNTLSEVGVIGLVVVGVVVGIGILAIWRNWNAASDGQYQRRIEVMLAALGGVAVHSLVDVFAVTAIVVILLLMIAYVMITPPKSRLDTPPTGSRFYLLVYGGVLLFYVGFFVRVDLADYYYQQSIQQGVSDAALESIEQAQVYDPWLNLYVLHEAWLLGNRNDRQRAIDAYEVALDKEPTWDMGWINYGILNEQAGNYALALESYKRVFAINVDEITSRFNWSRLAEAQNLAPTDEILKNYRTSIGRDAVGRLPTSEVWFETDLRREAITGALAHFDDDEISYRTLRYHDPTTAQTYVRENPNTAEQWWILGEEQFRQGDVDGAIISYSQAIRLDSTNGDYYVARARAYVANNDIQRAENDLTQAEFFGTLYEYPKIVWASMAANDEDRLNLLADALPLRFDTAEFSSTLYGRPAIWDIFDDYRLPGFGQPTINAWFDVVDIYIERGDIASAQQALRFIQQQAPYNSRAREWYQDISQTN